MKIFLSGVMQGSMKGKGIQGQGYRQMIGEAIKNRHPNAEIVDPFRMFPDSVDYDMQRAREVLFSMGEAAADADILVAYLPKASMGSAFEMLRAHDNGTAIISISPMEENWFIQSVSEKLFLSMDEFLAWLDEADLGEMVSG